MTDIVPLSKDQLPRIPPKHLKDGCYARADAIEAHLEAAKAENERLRAKVESLDGVIAYWKARAGDVTAESLG